MILAGLLACMTVASIAQATDHSEPDGEPVEGLAGARTDTRPCLMDRPGHLHGRLHGGFDARLDLEGEGLHCEGMLRPGRDGIRLFFMPAADRTPRISVVLGIDGEWPAITDGERATTVTLIDEDSGRFFSSGDQQRCWSRIHRLYPIEGTRPAEWRVEGEVFCVGSLPSLTDLASVTPGDLVFAGRLTEDADPE